MNQERINSLEPTLNATKLITVVPSSLVDGPVAEELCVSLCHENLNSSFLCSDESDLSGCALIFGCHYTIDHHQASPRASPPLSDSFSSLSYRLGQRWILPLSTFP